MQVEWSAPAVLGFVLFTLNVTLAFFILNARPDRLQNRFLAALVFLQGFVIGMRRGVLGILVDPASVAAAELVRVLLIVLYSGALLLFLSTLRTPWVRPLATKPGRILVATLSVATAAGVFMQAAVFDQVVTVNRPGSVFNLIPVVLWVYGAIVAISAHRAARGRLQRERTAWFSGAFVAYLSLLIVWMALTVLRAGPWHDFIADAGNLLFLSLMAYGILQHQIFDIDLRLKGAATRTMMAGLFVLVIFAVGETVEALVQDAAGQAASLAAAAALAISFRPIEGRLRRMTERLMPGVDDTAAYRLARRTEVYTAAVEDAMYDGVITGRERKILEGLARNLEISAAEAKRLERGVVAALPYRGPQRTADPLDPSETLTGASPKTR